MPIYIKSNLKKFILFKSTTLFCPISYFVMLPFLDDFQWEKLYCFSLMLSEKVGSNLFLLSNHSTKHSLLLLKGLFRVKGQAHSLGSAHATCHQYCSIHKGKAHFLSIINSWPMDHMQATREKILACPAARLPTVGKAG